MLVPSLESPTNRQTDQPTNQSTNNPARTHSKANSRPTNMALTFVQVGHRRPGRPRGAAWRVPAVSREQQLDRGLRLGRSRVGP
eukprot:306323-Chlamydomonas_euryale.AAC.3